VEESVDNHPGDRSLQVVAGAAPRGDFRKFPQHTTLVICFKPKRIPKKVFSCEAHGGRKHATLWA
jgi:hypothetical protein